MDTLITTRGAATIAAAAVIALVRKSIRVTRAVLTVTRRHVPAWVGTLLTVCLLIPGPVDELLVLLVIAGYVAFKPAMRADLAGAIRTA